MALNRTSELKKVHNNHAIKKCVIQLVTMKSIDIALSYLLSEGEKPMSPKLLDFVKVSTI